MKLVKGGSHLERTMLLHLRAKGLDKLNGGVVQEYRWATHLGRQWRFDFAWPDYLIAVECEGGTWVQGRHSRGKPFESDCEKYNAAAAEGWRVFRFTTDQINDGRAIQFLMGATEWLEDGEWVG